MMTTSARRRGAIAALVTSTVAGTHPPGWMAPANASTAPAEIHPATTVPDIAVSPAETAWVRQMGSRIRLHENVGSPVVTAPDVTQSPGLDARH
jgi:hypothetical protein